MDFFKTIRFKLTLWYSLLLFLFCLMFVGGINLVVGNYFANEPVLTILPADLRNRLPNRYRDLAREQRELITEIRQNDLEQIRKASMTALIPLTIMAFIGGYAVSGYMLKPIGDISKATKRITSRNLREKIPETEVDDELGELVKSFNNMLETLANSFDLQKQFIESASHELKTPLAIMQTNLDTLMVGSKATKQEMQHGVQVALKSVENMNKLVEDLLLLSANSGELHTENINLAKLLREITKSLGELYSDRELKLNLPKSNKQLAIEGNPFSLSRALRNLVENALKYSTPEDGKVEVSVTNLSHNRIQIEVADNGLGIAEADQVRIFDRFYRVDKSRSRQQGGTGLGLAIVSKIIEEHGGEISLVSELGEGSKFSIILPS